MDTKPFGLRPVWDLSRDSIAPELTARKRTVRQSDTSTYACGDLVRDLPGDPGIGGMPAVISEAVRGNVVDYKLRGALGVVVAVDPQTPVSPRAADGTYPFVPASKSRDYVIWVMEVGSRPFYCKTGPDFFPTALGPGNVGDRAVSVIPGPPGSDGLSGFYLWGASVSDWVTYEIAPTSEFPGNSVYAKGSVWIVRKWLSDGIKFL